MVTRFDVGSVRAPRETPEGWLRVDGYLTRVGIFVYRDGQGNERRELRKPEEVFDDESLRSFGLVPVTDNHPPTLLNATNAKQYTVGAVGENVRRDGEYVQASMLITDANTIAKINAGKVQLSCGYTCELKNEPGVWNGERYDAVQTNIRGNHLAIVDRGRAGPEVKLRLDGEDAAMVDPRGDTFDMKKITINGVDFEVTEQVAQAIERERADAAQREAVARKDATDARAELERHRARADVAEEKLTKEQQARKDAEDPARVRDLVRARASLEVRAARVLGVDTKLDTLDDKSIKLAVLKKLEPKLDLSGRADAYVDARFDGAIEQFETKNPALAAIRTAVEGGSQDPRVDSVDDDAARQRMLEHNRKISQPKS